MLDTAGNATVANTLAMGSSFLRNRIINGAMMIDQRNAGASLANVLGGTYSLDRWNIYGAIATKFTAQQNAASVTPPTGHKNYLGITSSSAYVVGASESFSVRQYIEGFNTADLGFGAAGASTVTLSFWVRSSLTGSFGGCLYNNAGDRFYPFSYTISSANTWEQKSITIAGDTSGTWIGATSGVGLAVQFSLGAGATVSGTAGAWTASTALQPTGSTSIVGTNGATWYITGVQLEAGTIATPFERRLYGQELALCQRYYFRSTATGGGQIWGSGFNNTTTTSVVMTAFPVPMRIAPSSIETTGTATDYSTLHNTSLSTCSAVPFLNIASVYTARYTLTVGSGLTVGQGAMSYANNTTAYLGWSAEL